MQSKLFNDGMGNRTFCPIINEDLNQNLTVDNQLPRYTSGIQYLSTAAILQQASDVTSFQRGCLKFPSIQTFCSPTTFEAFPFGD